MWSYSTNWKWKIARNNGIDNRYLNNNKNYEVYCGLCELNLYEKCYKEYKDKFDKIKNKNRDIIQTFKHL